VGDGPLRRFSTVCWLAIAFISVPQASAQTLYKSIRPDGSVEYSDKPTRDAIRIERYDLAPQDPQEAARAERQRAADAVRLREFEAKERRREQALDRADAEVLAAIANLQRAQRELDGGVEPQPGDNVGTAGGFARRSDAYYARLQQLSDSVAAAQRRLDRAYAARNALRD